MTDTKNEAPERLWAWSFNIWDTWGGYARPENRHPLDERERRTGAEYVRADLLADMTRQRDDQAAALILAKEALGKIIPMDRIHGLTPDSGGRQIWHDGECGAVARAALDAINAEAEGAKQ